MGGYGPGIGGGDMSGVHAALAAYLRTHGWDHPRSPKTSLGLTPRHRLQRKTASQPSSLPPGELQQTSISQPHAFTTMVTPFLPFRKETHLLTALLLIPSSALPKNTLPTCAPASSAPLPHPSSTLQNMPPIPSPSFRPLHPSAPPCPLQAKSWPATSAPNLFISSVQNTQLGRWLTSIAERGLQGYWRA